MNLDKYGKPKPGDFKLIHIEGELWRLTLEAVEETPTGARLTALVERVPGPEATDGEGSRDNLYGDFEEA